MSAAFRGVFTIPSTPFDEDLEVDWEGLRRIVDFCVGCGAHGIVWPVNASAFAVLSDEERLKGAQLVVEQVAGRVPVVIGTQGVCTSHAAMFSRHANEIGADAVMAMAPYIQPVTDEEELLNYYRGISDAVCFPVFIQNHTRGSVLSVKTMARIVQEVEHVEYVKEETFPVTHKLTQVLEMAGPKLKGVFGGAGGRYLLLEHPRGVAGQMPGCHVTDVVVRLWNALEVGDLGEAKRVYGLLAPLFALEMVRGTSYPEVLRRRGVIKSSRGRLAGPSATDEHDHGALDDILRDLEPLFTWHDGGPILYGERHAERGEASPAERRIESSESQGVAPFDQVA
jgi:4-hydroxy-tetrahydrodipicolinate synthase